MFHRSRRLQVELLEDRRLLSVASVGDPFAANTQTVGDQVTFGQSRAAAVATDRAGNFVAVWSSEVTSGSGYDVYGQRFDSAGTPVGTEFLVNETTTSEQKFPGVAMDADGDFVVTWSSLWQDGSLYGVYARRYDATGTPQSGEFRVNETITGNQNFSDVAIDDDGDFTIAWTATDQDGDRTGIFARRYAADGTPASGEFGVNTTTAGNQRYPVVASDAVGGMVAAWTSDGQDGSSGGIFAQRFDLDGNPVGSEFAVNTTTDGNQQLPSVAVAPGGNFLIAWQGFDLTAGEWKVYVQAYDGSGAAVGAEAVAGSGRYASATISSTGDFVVAWEAPSVAEPNHTDIYVQHFDPLGTVDGSAMAYYNAEASLTAPSVATQQDNAVLLWTANRYDGLGSDVHGQRIHAALSGTYNQPPVLSLPADMIVDENDLISLTFSAVDPDLPAQDLTFALVGNNPAGAALDSVTGQFTWTPDESHGGQTYDFAVRVTDSGTPGLTDLGNFSITVNEVNQPPVLEPIGDRRISELSLVSFTAGATDPDLPPATFHYSLTGAVPAGAVIDELTGEFTWTPIESQAPGVYTFTVEVSDGELTDSEEITITISVAHFYGSAGDDTIEVAVGETGGAWHSVTINGTTDTYDPALVDTLRIDGLEGTDQLFIVGTAGDDEATLASGSIHVQGTGYSLDGVNVETIHADAGAGEHDLASLCGSDGSNRLYSYADHSMLMDTPRTFRHLVYGFETVSADVSTTGRNYAFLYDSSGNDVLTASPDGVSFDREDGSSQRSLTGFQRVYAYATSGGTDSASLSGADAAGNRLYSYADYSILTESARSFYFYARGFGTVMAQSPGAGATYAYLYDSQDDDVFVATPASASMDRADPWSDTTAAGFQRVYAYSTRGGNDTATLQGAPNGGNQLQAYPTYGTLTDRARSFYHYARGFRWLTAEGSQTDPSSDRAYLYDSTGDDIFHDDGEYGYLEDKAGTGYQNRFRYFDVVYARSIDEGTDDTIDIAPEQVLLYTLIRSGTW